MLQRTLTGRSRTPLRPIRVLIESDRLAAGSVRSLGVGGIDVTVCSGPAPTHEYCPLVTDGRCPAGPCDVVVSSLDQPWGESVHRAWTREGVVAIRINDGAPPVGDPFDMYVGAALTALHRACYSGARDHT